jgi:OmpR family response regulator RpaB
MGEKAKKILVVEDNTTLATMLEYLLKGEGYEVLVTEDAEKALEEFKRMHPDLIISDIMLPKTDGFEFAKIVHRSSDVPVIILTALGGEENRNRGEDVGAVDFITKPFDPMDLLHRVKAVLEKR